MKGITTHAYYINQAQAEEEVSWRQLWHRTHRGCSSVVGGDLAVHTCLTGTSDPRYPGSQGITTISHSRGLERLTGVYRATVAERAAAETQTFKSIKTCVLVLGIEHRAFTLRYTPSPLKSFISFYFEKWSHQVSKLSRVELSWQSSSCLKLPAEWETGMYGHTWLLEPLYQKSSAPSQRSI